jgi:type VI secretion system secreted protein Hcp
MTQSGTMHLGGGGGAGKASFQDLSVTKYVDKSSTDLMKACVLGDHIATGTLTVRKAGSKPLEYIIIELKDCLITSVQAGGSGGEDRLTENVSINFREYKVKYQPQKGDGSKDGGVLEHGFDIAQNTAT